MVTGVVATLVTARSQHTKRFGYLIRGAFGSDSTNHHVGVSGCSASYTSAGVVTTSAIERSVRIGLRMQLRLYKGLLGLLPNGHVTCRSVRGDGHDPRGHRISPACSILSGGFRSGCVVLFSRGRAGPSKCVRPELSERGG